jgi:hypothetical protein
MAIGSDNAFPKLILVEGSAPASPAAGRQDLFIDSADHHLKRVNSSGTVTDLEAGGGGGSTLGAIIAYNSYDPATLATYTTTSTSATDCDATNMAVTFTAPSSGKVLVRLTAAGNSSGGTGVLWHIRESTTTLATRFQKYINGATATDYPGSAAFVITGLTSGSSHTYKWAHSCTSGATSKVYAGGSGSVGPAVMEVFSLP